MARRAVCLVALACGLATAGCSRNAGVAPWYTGATPATHAAFPVAIGVHAVDCNVCHGPFTTFKQFTCLGCHAHDQMVTDPGHFDVPGYSYASTACYACHADPSKLTPPSGVTSDPSQNVVVSALVPMYSGPSIAVLTPALETLPMGMDHRSAQLGTVDVTRCEICHDPAGPFFPGSLHSSLANAGLPQPTACVECHHVSVPTGFVGPTATRPARTPPSGEMKHDAVAWVGGAPGTTPLVTADCGVCHASPSAAAAATWATGVGSTSVRYHASLAAAQPGSCIDCHANGRPAGVLDAAHATLPAGLTFDHGQGAALADCAGCHGGAAASATSWAGGKFHPAGSATPATCLPCHEGERPGASAPAGWADPAYPASPFDYGPNAIGTPHGAGQDCVVCHTGPGSGAWGGTQNWQHGHFAHGPGTVAATTCASCHTTQRPDLQPGTTAAAMAALLKFDHSVNGTGDCAGCHQATVVAGTYVHYANPATGALPGGDWKDGSGYPGEILANSLTAPVSMNVATLTLLRSSATALVTGLTSTTTTLYNQMLHTASTIPQAIRPGPAASPDFATCASCHATVSGAVQYAEGHYHASLTALAYAQPVAGCTDCHVNMRPPGIVEPAAGADLQPMDHAALFTAPVNVGGVTVTGVAQMDCSACHQSPGSTWADGRFHASIGSGVPRDCVACHYPLMIDAPRADATSGTAYAMKHGSAQLTIQACATCHPSALAGAGAGTVAATAWRPGALHASVPAQPTACIDCHAPSRPAAATASAVTYALAQGGTATNGAQWMNHQSGSVSGRDCAACHATDARPSGAAWSRTVQYHAIVTAPATCRECHGLGNGSTVPGTNNNLPAGLTSSRLVSSAALDPATGVPAGTHDQITHADVNVSSHDCGFCHTQRGVSSAAGVAGQEWAQARFHMSFSAAFPLVIDGSTGRCSNCHLNVKPTAAYAAFNHGSFTAAPGTQDCSSCHSWPGTGGMAAPNWLGAAGAPQYITVGGFTIPAPPAAAPVTQGGIASLPHPTSSTACASCHAGGTGGKGAIGYDHLSSLITLNCNACHEAGSNLLGTPWNGATSQAAGAGDTRPYTLTAVTARRGTSGGTCNITYAKHFYPVDCKECHPVPSGNGTVTTGTAYASAWIFPHSTSKMSNPGTCNMCHQGTGCSK